MRQQRIAFVSEHASPAALIGGADAGGQNIYVDEVGRHLGAMGYAVDVFTRRECPSAPEIVPWAAGVRIVNVAAGPARVIAKDALWPFMPAFRDEILRFMAHEDGQYDLVHSNFWMSGWVATEIGDRLGLPAVHIFHALGLTKRREQGAADTSPRRRIQVEMGVVRRVEALIAQCPAERAELINDYAAQPAKIGVIPAGVDLDRFRPIGQDEARARIGVEPDRPVIAYVGRLLPRKDIGNIVRALALLRPAGGGGTALPRSMPLLLVVGGAGREPDPTRTPEIGTLQRLAAELGIGDQVRFVGHRQPEELRWYYGAADVAVTTPWYEPFGLTPLEAMACGRAVIGAAVGGITSTVQTGVTGYLVPPRDPAALADRLECLLARPMLRQRMGQAGRARVEQEFGWHRTAARTAALYQSVLAAKGAGRLTLVPTR